MEEGDAYGVESVSLYQGYRRRLVSLSEQTPSAWRSRRTREEARFGASTQVRSQPSKPSGGLWKARQRIE